MTDYNFDDKDDPGFTYPFENRYRLFREIEIEDSGHHLTFYGPYHNHLAKEVIIKGMNNLDSWDEVVRVWTPDTRIFAKLPIYEDDIPRIIEGNKPYIVISHQGIEKINKPFGYGTSDYWASYHFKNINKSEAAKLIGKLVELGCPPNKYNVGLELKVSKQELNKLAREKRKLIEQKVFSVMSEVKRDKK